MATYVKYQEGIESLLEATNLGTDTLKLALTNTAPNVSTHTILGDITEITAQNGYTAGGETITITASAQTTGTYKLEGNDVVFTATGGSFGPFRYVVFYSDTPTVPVDPIFGYWDYGSSITLNDTETFTVDFNATNGIIQAT